MGNLTEEEKSELFNLFISLDIEVWNQLLTLCDEETAAKKMENFRKICSAIYHILGLEEKLSRFLGIQIEDAHQICKNCYAELRNRR